jgi:hypothetical protein
MSQPVVVRQAWKEVVGRRTAVAHDHWSLVQRVILDGLPLELA